GAGASMCLRWKQQAVATPLRLMTESQLARIQKAPVSDSRHSLRNKKPFRTGWRKARAGRLAPRADIPSLPASTRGDQFLSHLTPSACLYSGIALPASVEALAELAECGAVHHRRHDWGADRDDAPHLCRCSLSAQRSRFAAGPSRHLRIG